MDHDDDRLLSELAAAYRTVSADDVARAARAGKAAFELAALDEELTFAALVYDSMLDREPALTRDAHAPRMLMFECDSCSVQLEINDDGILGQVVPAEAGSVVAEFGDGESSTAVTDPLGCFALSGLPAGPFRLRVRAGTWALVTEWTSLRPTG
jgi:hypothetical protein